MVCKGPCHLFRQNTADYLLSAHCCMAHLQCIWIYLHISEALQKLAECLHDVTELPAVSGIQQQ